MIIYIHGPPACGKTRNADRFKAAFFADRVIELEDALGLHDACKTVVVLGPLEELAPRSTTLVYEFDKAMRVVETYEQALRNGKTDDELRGAFAEAMFELAAQALAQGLYKNP